MAVPPKAISTVSTARPRSEENTAFTPDRRRRFPSPAAWSLPRSDSRPSFQPVATPASLSVVVECVSKTISVGMELIF